MIREKAFRQTSRYATQLLQITTVLVATLFISSCSHNSPAVQNTNNTSTVFRGTHLFVNQCHNKVASGIKAESLLAEIGGSLATGIVKTGIDWIGSALQKAAQDDVYITTAIANQLSLDPLSKSSSKICLQVVRGSFKYAKQSKKSYSNPFSVDPANRMVAPLEVVEGSEELFIEILPIIHKQFISFTPLEVRYSGYTPNDKRSKRPRDLAIFVGFSPSSNDVTSGNYAGRLINFGSMAARSGKPAVKKYVSDSGKLSLALQTQWLGISEDIKNNPFSFATNIIETREAGKFTKFLASAFAESQDDIKNQAVTAVSELEVFKSKQALEKERIAAEQEQLDAEEKYLEAEASIIGYQSKLTSICTNGGADQITIHRAQMDLYLAKKQANIASSLAGKGRPYPLPSLHLPNGRCN